MKVTNHTQWQSVQQTYDFVWFCRTSWSKKISTSPFHKLRPQMIREDAAACSAEKVVPETERKGVLTLSGSSHHIVGTSDDHRIGESHRIVKVSVNHRVTSSHHIVIVSRWPMDRIVATHSQSVRWLHRCQEYWSLSFSLPFTTSLNTCVSCSRLCLFDAMQSNIVPIKILLCTDSWD